MSEAWRPVVGYEGLYEVSDHGRIRSLPRIATYHDGRQRALRACRTCANERERRVKRERRARNAAIGSN